MIKRHRFWCIAIVLALAGPPGFAAVPTDTPQPDSVVFYFSNGNASLTFDNFENAFAGRQLDRILKPQSPVDSIVIRGGASIPGSGDLNSRLAYQRAAAIRSYIRTRYPQISSRKIHLSWSTINWDALQECVENDPFVPNRDDLLTILSLPVNANSKLVLISTLDNGKTENYIINNYSKDMRAATVVVKLNESTSSTASDDSTVMRSGLKVNQGSIRPESVDSLKPAFTTQENQTTGEWVRKPLFALKTNLLFDVASMLNIEFEVPIGQRWSVAAEGIFPWWLWENKQYALQITSGNVEARYWWGDRSKRDQLTGWFTGVYAGAGLYDIEWESKGYQGEFLISTGISAGYAHKIGKNWHMEYSLGAGYMSSKYREYVPTFGEDGEWHLIRQRSGNFSWIGPTKVKVSLVWILNHGYQKKGGK